MADASKSTQPAAKNAARSLNPESRGAKPSAVPLLSGNFGNSGRHTNDRRPFITSAFKRRSESMSRPYGPKLQANEAIGSGGKRAKRIKWETATNDSEKATKLSATAAPFTPLKSRLRYPPWNKDSEPLFGANGVQFVDDKWGRARTKYREWFDLSSYPDGDREFDYIDPKTQALIELAVERSFTVPVLKFINNCLKFDKKDWADPDEAKRAGFAKTGPPGLHRSTLGSSNDTWGAASSLFGPSMTKQATLDVWEEGARARRERERRLPSQGRSGPGLRFGDTPARAAFFDADEEEELELEEDEDDELEVSHHDGTFLGVPIGAEGESAGYSYGEGPFGASRPGFLRYTNASEPNDDFKQAVDRFDARF